MPAGKQKTKKSSKSTIQESEKQKDQILGPLSETGTTAEQVTEKPVKKGRKPRASKKTDKPKKQAGIKKPRVKKTLQDLDKVTRKKLTEYKTFEDKTKKLEEELHGRENNTKKLSHPQIASLAGLLKKRYDVKRVSKLAMYGFIIAIGIFIRAIAIKVREKLDKDDANVVSGDMMKQACEELRLPIEIATL